MSKSPKRSAPKRGVVVDTDPVAELRMEVLRGLSATTAAAPDPRMEVLQEEMLALRRELAAVRAVPPIKEVKNGSCYRSLMGEGGVCEFVVDASFFTFKWIMALLVCGAIFFQFFYSRAL